MFVQFSVTFILIKVRKFTVLFDTQEVLHNSGILQTSPINEVNKAQTIVSSYYF